MVIGHDQVHPEPLRSVGGGECPDASVDADDQANPIFSGSLDYIVFHAVAFFETVRHIKISDTTRKFDGCLQNHNRGCAIDIVVAVDQDFFLALDCRIEPLDGPAHSFHQVRGMQVAQGWCEISLCGFSILNAAHEQKTGKRGSLPRVSRQSECRERSELVGE